jgi:rare lipoprotein A
MNRFAGATLILLLAGLAACASRTPIQSPAHPPAQSPAPSPAAPPAPPEAPSATQSPQASADQPIFTQSGLASLYGAQFDGNKTASGDQYDGQGLTAAHRSLAFGTIVRVTNTANGRSVKVAINDRGPHVKNRIIDLSYAAARALGVRKGLMRVRLEVFAGDQTSQVRPSG